MIKQKVIRVTMPDGSLYDVPVSLVAEDCAAYYTRQEMDKDDGIDDDWEMIFRAEKCRALADPGALLDWLKNMDWSEVADEAVQVERLTSADFQKGWREGNKEIVEVEM